MVELAASYRFPRPAAFVYALLTDPDAVAACLPGCEGLERIGDDRYRARLNVAVSAVSGQYSGTVSIVDQQPPGHYRLVVEGSGRAGFVKGDGTIDVIDEDGATTVRVSGQAEVGGLIARVGQRLIGSVAKMTMDRFFACMIQKASSAEPPTT